MSTFGNSMTATFLFFFFTVHFPLNFDFDYWRQDSAYPYILTHNSIQFLLHFNTFLITCVYWWSSYWLPLVIAAAFEAIFQKKRFSLFLYFTHASTLDTFFSCTLFCSLAFAIIASSTFAFFISPADRHVAVNLSRERRRQCQVCVCLFVCLCVCAYVNL